MFGFFAQRAERKAAIAAEELANRKASWDVKAEPMTDKEVMGFMEWAWKQVKEDNNSLFQNGALRYMRPGVADYLCITYTYLPRLVALARAGVDKPPFMGMDLSKVVMTEVSPPCQAFAPRDNVVPLRPRSDTSDISPEIRALFDVNSPHSYEDLKQRYFAALLLLCDASPYVPESERERMELVLEDAIEYHPELTFRRVYNAFMLEVK